MGKIVSIVSSPREQGNTDVLVHKTMVGAMGLSTNTFSLYRIARMRMRGCMACDSCKTQGRCVQEDELTQVMDDLVSADALIVSTPVYFGQASWAYRIFEDRMYGFVRGDFTCAIEPKKLAIVVTSGSGAGATDIEAMMKKVMVNYFKFEPMGSIVFSEAQSGPAKDSAEVMAAAEELAKKL